MNKFLISLTLLFVVLFLVISLPISGQAARFPIPVATPTNAIPTPIVYVRWERSCSGDLILSESIYEFEVMVTCKQLPKNWQRGCYGVVHTSAVPGERRIFCTDLGIP